MVECATKYNLGVRKYAKDMAIAFSLSSGGLCSGGGSPTENQQIAEPDSQSAVVDAPSEEAPADNLPGAVVR